MRWASIFAHVIAQIYILSLPLTGVNAQELPGRVAGATPGASPVPISGDVSGPSKAMVDVLFGKNARGPYILSWKPVDRFSERVRVDGNLTQREFDYDIDYAAGRIAFYQPISQSSIIRIEYNCDPSKAVKNTTGLNVPLTLDLLRKDNADLQFIGLYKQTDQTTRSPSDVSVIGLSGGAKAREGGFSSTILFNPESVDRDGRDHVSMDDRSMLKVDGSTRTDNFQLSTKYVRVGEQFSGAREFNMNRGAEVLDVAASFKPSDAIAVTSSLTRTESPSADKRGHVDSTTVHSVVISPDGAPRLTVARTEVERERPDAELHRTTTDSMRIEHTLSPHVTALATRQDVTTRIGEAESRLVTDEVVIGAKPSDNLSMTGRVTQKDSSQAGKETGIGLDVQASPLDRLSVRAAISRIDSEKSGEQKFDSISLRADPDKNVKVEASLVRKETDAAGSELAHAVKVVSTPLSDVHLELGLTGVSADLPKDESTRQVKLSTTALKNTRVQMDLIDKDSEAKGAEELRSVRVESSPTEAITVSGIIAQRDTPDVRELTREARVEVTPFDRTQIGGAIREVESNGSTVGLIREVTASTRAIDFIEFSGTYKNREALNQDALDTLDMSFLFDTGGSVKLIAGYTRNPEDKKGVVQQVDSRSYGLVTDMGRLRLEGSFSERNEYLAGRRSEKMDLALDYRLSSDSLLTTSYTTGAYANTSAPGASTLALEYTRKVGSRMNIQFGARVTTFDAGQSAMPDPADYQAEAKFGLRF